MHDSVTYLLFLIFTGAALVATVALYARQALIVAYIALGIVLGPSLLDWAPDTHLIQQLSETGIIFLLFLLGLNLHPQKLYRLFRDTLLVTVSSSVIFAAVGYALLLVFGYSSQDALLVGVCSMFSSTIIGLKLLPTTVLHHQHMGGLIISILLLQDIIAIVVLLFIQAGSSDLSATGALIIVLGLPTLALAARRLEKWIITPLLTRFDTIQEYIFLLAIGWCLGMAELAQSLGLSAEIGAFVAGVAIAATPIATFIAESLKPLRDFFLVMFFFALGAQFNLHNAYSVILPATVLTLTMLLLKPRVFSFLLSSRGEQPRHAKEMGYRLGQLSEFSLLIAMLAFNSNILSAKASSLLQTSIVLGFLVSPYLIVLRFPTPIAIDPKLRRD